MKRGRPKGSITHLEVTYEELGDWVGKKTKIPVSKKWLEFIMGEEAQNFSVDTPEEDVYDDEDSESKDLENKIQYNLTSF